MNARVLPGLLALVLIVGFASLGNWQLRRANEKQQTLDEVASALRDKLAVPLAQAQDGSANYAWVTASGSFLPSPILLLDNQRLRDRVGVHVFGIFRPDGAMPLLVNLGWIAVPGNRTLPSVRLPRGRHSLAGMLSPPPASGIALGPAYVAQAAAADAQVWLLTRVDLEAISAGTRTSLAPRILRLDPASPLGYQRTLDVLPNTLPPERHRGYALQWFGLALATVVVALLLAFRRKSR